MIRTSIYILGTLALHHTDLHHPDGFYSLLLPLLDTFFFIFIIWQMMFYFALNNFSDGRHYGFHDLVIDIYDLRYDIQDHGIIYALYHLMLNILDLICILVASYYYGIIIIDILGS